MLLRLHTGVSEVKVRNEDLVDICMEGQEFSYLGGLG